MVNATEYQNIVIIGGAGAGHKAANALVPTLPATHRILLIDANDFAYHTIGALRASVVPGWEEKVFAPLRTSTVFKEGSPHAVIAPNRVAQLKENSVVLEKPWEGALEITFFKCIIATGSSQPSPMRATDGSVEGAKAAMRKLQEDVKEAKKVVIIGGGVVGVEFAGEVRDEYPDKSITIIHNSPALLSAPPKSSAARRSSKPGEWVAPTVTPKLSAMLDRDLRLLNVDLVLSDRAEPSNASGEWDGTFGALGGEKTLRLKSGKEVKADFVFVSVGNKPNASLVEKADKGAVIGGMVAVDEYLRVVSPNGVLRNYYAIGDCCTTPGWKTAQGAGADGQFVSVNIVNEVKQLPLKVYTRPVMHGVVVPLGKAKGQGMLTVPYFGTWHLPARMVVSVKGKGMLLDHFTGMFEGSEKLPADVYA